MNDFKIIAVPWPEKTLMYECHECIFEDSPCTDMKVTDEKDPEGTLYLCDLCYYFKFHVAHAVTEEIFEPEEVVQRFNGEPND